MSQTNSKDSEENNEDDEWHKFSNAGYSSASVDSDAEIDKNVNDNQSGVWFDGDDFEFEGKTLDWNSPPCPTPLGVAHVIKIGTCNHCIERVSGKKNMSGEEIRSEAHVRDGTLDKSFETILCPLCENLFDDIGNIVNRIVDKISNLEYSTIQIGIHLPKDLINDEDEIRSRHGATGSRPLKSAMVVAIQNEININLGTDVNFV
ncbi:MAG: hypothetical protein ACKVGY_07125, partial [Candidatus Poseidoniales archaeon]